MFNAKSLLDALVAAGSQAGQANAPAKPGSLSGSLGGLAEQFQRSGGLGGLAGMAGQILGGQGAGGQAQPGTEPRKPGTPGNDPLAGFTGGRSAQDLLAQAKGMLEKNPAMATAVLGGLGSLVFGSKKGRSVLGSAAKLGGLALIGGLAYKAWQNHQAGKPLLGVQGELPAPAPAGTGFEPEAASEETAQLLIRAMIAAAAADGSIDAQEREAILGGLREAGMDAEANDWLNREMAGPASVEALVAQARTPEVRAEVYTAARVAINPDTAAEKDFLAGLGGALGLDAELIANIDAAVSAAKV